MKPLKTLILLLVLATVCVASSRLQTPNYQAVIGWEARFGTAGSETKGLLTTIDSSGNVYFVTRVVTANMPDIIQMRKLSAYGAVLKMWTIPTGNIGYARAIKTDGLGDVFLLLDLFDPSFTHTTVLDGWDSAGNALFSKTLSPTGFTIASGLALGTDSSNRVYAGLLSSSTQTNGYEVLHSAFSRTGVAGYTANYPFYSDYARFDSTGRMSAVGYIFGQNFTEACAVVFGANGAVVFHKTLLYTKTTSYYFGIGAFDAQGNYYLSTDTAASSNSSTVQCMSPTFATVWTTPAIPGFVYYGSAKNSADCFVWGSSDASYTTGYFLVFLDNGAISRNTQTATGNAIHGVYDGCVWIEEDFSTGDIEIWYTENPFLDWPPILIGRIKGADGSYEDINDVDDDDVGDVVFAYEDLDGNGVVLVVRDADGVVDYLGLPSAAESGEPEEVDLDTNGPEPEDEQVALTANNGATFAATGTSTETVTIPKGATKVATTLNAPATNVDENVTVVAHGQGVVRQGTMKVSHAKIKKITCTSPITRGNAIPYTVELDGEAGKGGVLITVTTSSSFAPGGSTTVDDGETSQSSLTGDTKGSTPNGTVVTLTATDPDGNKVTCTCTVNQ